jgi:hypothetical protein
MMANPVMLLTRKTGIWIPAQSSLLSDEQLILSIS